MLELLLLYKKISLILCDSQSGQDLGTARAGPDAGLHQDAGRRYDRLVGPRVT